MEEKEKGEEGKGGERGSEKEEWGGGSRRRK